MNEDTYNEMEDNSCDSDDEDSDTASSFSDDDDSSLGSDMDDDTQQLWDAVRDAAVAVSQSPPPVQSTEEALQGILTCIHESKTIAIKLDDRLFAFMGDIMDENVKEAAVNKLADDLVSAARSCKEVRHVILGTSLLKLLGSGRQTQLFQTLISAHASSITYWKLGSDDSMDLCGIPTLALLQEMMVADWPNLTEFQLRGLELSTRLQVDLLVGLLQKFAPTVKLFNLLGIVLTSELLSSAGLFDSLWTTVGRIKQLDEVQLHRTFTPEDPMNIPPLVSHAALQDLLQVKPKWWRMALDGMGLDDGHTQILGSALKKSPDCKMNDILSLRNNPKITSKGLSSLYNVCLNKQRMGLVQSDDQGWVATFDLVRPLNNLHRRLEYKNAEGRFVDPQRWMEWFQVLSDLPWIDDTRKLNYIWFTLCEQPEMIQSAIASRSTTTSNSVN